MQFGCDNDADQIVWTGTCPKCLHSDITCPHCMGRGEIDYRRCPTSMSDATGRAVINATRLASYGIMPIAAGWGEQAAVGATLLDIANSEIARIQEARSSSST